MADPEKPSGDRGKGRSTHLLLGLLCLLFFLNGLGELPGAIGAGDYFKLTLSVIMLVSGGIGAGVSGWLAFRKSG